MAGADQSRVDCPRTGHQVRDPEGPAGAEADDGAVRGALGGRSVLPAAARAASHQLPVDAAVPAGLRAHGADVRLDAHPDRHGPCGHPYRESDHGSTLTIGAGAVSVSDPDAGTRRASSAPVKILSKGAWPSVGPSAWYALPREHVSKLGTGTRASTLGHDGCGTGTRMVWRSRSMCTVQ